MRPFTWLAPDTTEEAVALLREHGSGARVIAGGQSLLLAMKERTVGPSHLVSLGGITGLAGVTTEPDGALVVGAATTYAALTRAALRGWHGVLSDVAGDLADRPVRNRGTIGGALCAADPRFDVPAFAVGVDAVLRISGAGGDRTLPAGEFLLGNGLTAIGQDEILTAVVLPPPATWDAVVFEKFRHRVFDAAIVSATCALRRGSGATPAAVRVTVAGATATPVVLAVDAGATGAHAGDLAAASVLPDATDEATRYRRELVRTLVRRTVDRARTQQGSA
ncbi:FAD binding domain-containing protein [Pseudonocardia dioxanivorans]|uniref:FAD binding domain-containing protein n=1 Tax=Pseudonocardia dioxanivorans TaxID=240495 RepID=UPI000CD07164|nr:FAD binding domain-containing protein [Pseudonocardia dioxanivorans]